MRRKRADHRVTSDMTVYARRALLLGLAALAVLVLIGVVLVMR